MIGTLRKTIRSFGWNTRVLRWTVASLLLCRVFTATAQDSPELDPVYTYEFNGLNADFYSDIYDYNWLPNNILSIDDLMLDPETGDVTPFSVIYDPYPLETQMRLPPPTAPAVVLGLSPVFNIYMASSPDGRFDLYRVAHSFKNANDKPLPHTILGLVDRETGQTVKLPTIGLEWLFYDIAWSADGSAFVITMPQTYGAAYYAYVTGFAEDVTQAQGTLLMSWGPLAEKLQWGIYQFYDLDSTGRYLLADGYLIENDVKPGAMHLLVIDMQDLSYEVVGTEPYFRGAGFEKPDDQTVFYVSRDGVFAYDRQDQTHTLLTDKLNADDMVMEYMRFHPSFSPDGRFLATQISDGMTQFKIAVFPIPPIPEDK